MFLYHALENFFNTNSSEIAAECIKMFGISRIAETVAMRRRRDGFIKRFMSNSSIQSVKFVVPCLDTCS